MKLLIATRTSLSTLLVLSACGGGGLSDSTSPPPPRDTTSTAPVVQRTSLTVQVAIDAADTTLARGAGVSGAGVVVRLERTGAGSTPIEATTGADGRVTFSNLLEGSYSVTALRTLTATEIGRLSVDDRDVSVLAGGTVTALTPPTPRAVQLDLVASRRGSLVISEMYAYLPSFGNVPYNYAHYTEFTNVADTTIYLDGLMVVRTVGQIHGGFPSPAYCTDLAELRMDESALWVNQIYRFPGNGRDHPLAPGGVVVWALDAINHGAVAPGTPDLSRAQFEEIGGPGDVDNPTALKMERLSRSASVIPHGFPMLPGNITAVVRPIARDTNALERRVYYPELGGMIVWRIPREAVLDLVALQSTVERYTGTGAYRGGFRYCEPWITPAHDRAFAQLYDNQSNTAIRRRLIGTTRAGVPILQRTRTSARDLEVTAVPLQRSLNKQ